MKPNGHDCLGNGKPTTDKRTCRLPVVFCSNTQSVRHKINDLSASVQLLQADIVCAVETWLNSDIDDGCLSLGDKYSPPQRHDRTGRIGGGVAVWVHQDFAFKVWENLATDDVETIWLTVWSNRMPRYCNRIILGVIYHDNNTRDGHLTMANHIISAVDHIRRLHPYAGLVLVGDFNQFPIHMISSQLQVQQLVKQPTRGDSVLDKFLTDKRQLYPSCNTAASVGNSDHLSIISYPKTSSYDKGESGTFTTRVYGHNEKALFAHSLSNVKWEQLYRCEDVNEKVGIFTRTLQDLYNTCFPLKTVKRHSNDKPWVTDYFRSLVSQRQYALKTGNVQRYKQLRNKVTRMSKKLERSFYTSKVEHLRTCKSRDWWKHMKELLGMKSTSVQPLQSLVKSTTQGDINEFAEEVNIFFESVSSHLNPLSPNNPFLQLQCSLPDKFSVSVMDVEKRLLSLNTRKAAGPDGLPVWIYQDFAHVLAGPLASITNASLRNGCIPDEWKLSNTVPLPKTKPPTSIESDLRPISITSVAAKIVEYFPVKFMQDSIKSNLDPNQFGGIQGTSTEMALLTLLDHVSKSTDNSNTAVRMILCDFSKAFDLVDHNVLVDKLNRLGAHDSLTKWAANFLRNRTQQVKIGSAVSSVVTMKAGCPQGTLLGPLAFVSYINDLCPPNELYTIKYVDDTTVMQASDLSEVCNTSLQQGMEYLKNWARDNKMRFNSTKTKEIVFDFKKSRGLPPKLTMDGVEIEQVSEAKILGVTLRSDLKWNSHIATTIRKANKRLYLLRLCKRAGLKTPELLSMYTSLIRSILEYCCIVFHSSLPEYLHNDLERIQKRAMTIIFPDLTYAQSLDSAKMKSLYDRREAQCEKMFRAILNENHKLHSLLPKSRALTYTLRNVGKLPQIRTRTQRYFNSFVPYCLRKLQ